MARAGRPSGARSSPMRGLELSHVVESIREPAMLRAKRSSVVALVVVTVAVVVAGCGNGGDGASAVDAARDRTAGTSSVEAALCTDLGTVVLVGEAAKDTVVLEHAEEVRVADILAWETATRGVEADGAPVIGNDPRWDAYDPATEFLVCAFSGAFNIPGPPRDAPPADRGIVVIDPATRDAFVYAIGPADSFTLIDVEDASAR